MTVRQQQFCSGVLFFVFGVGTFLLSSQYSMWVGRRVGSGLFPAGLGIILAVIGVIVFLQGFTASKQKTQPWKVRPILTICLAIVAFALLVERTGVLIALAVAALIAGYADKPNFRYLAIVYVVIVAFVYFFLIGVINLPYKLF